jgi:hypothetical protein
MNGREVRRLASISKRYSDEWQGGSPLGKNIKEIFG